MKIVDANLLLYAFDSESPSHTKAKTWLERIYRDDDLVGLPRHVLLAFIRISTNPRIMKTPAKPEAALAIVESLISHPKTLLVECGPNHWPLFRSLVIRAGVSGPSISDAFLATLAIEHGATLCSCDEGFRRYADLSFENPILRS
jgi:toxin-antitoxin system PIN domain toxin